MDVVGYGDRLSVAGGERISFMISSSAPVFTARIVRLIHGDTNPRGPGFKAEPVASSIDGDHPGRHQPLRLGSYVRVPYRGRGPAPSSFTVQLWVRPTLLTKPVQTLVSQRAPNGQGFAVRLENARLCLRLGEHGLVRSERELVADVWHFVTAVHDAATGRARVVVEPAGLVPVERRQAAEAVVDAASATPGDIVIAAEEDWPGGEATVTNFFNGKIAAPRLFARALSPEEIGSAVRVGVDRLVAAWDFSRDIGTSDVSDTSGRRNHGRTVNLPMRAATGPDWSGVETSWRHAPEQYGAIHFHDDDLGDAGWEPSLTWTVPEGLASGVYALHLEAGRAEDYVPFAVRPRPGRPTASIALLLPTFSYLAYANEQLMMNRPPDRRGDYPQCPQDRYIVENRLLSLYDRHSDGSGVCYASKLRPLVNLRPKYSMPGFADGGTPHQFNADLHLVDWLHVHGYVVDVITDEDLHHEGAELLAPYRTVITGTHCEYWSGAMLDAAQAYLHGGGKLMYLGGNGMYWVTQLDPTTGSSIEIRRRGPATRTWEPAPGEAHLSASGELGGLWRFRGRSPQSWLGVGFTAETTSTGRPYARGPGSFDPRAAFVFAGVGDDELIGDTPNLARAYGAAGYEFDRADAALGTPAHTLVLATATGFSDDAQAVAEEIMLADSAEGGTVNPRVRADMVLLDYPSGGAVFSVGSMTWCGCLSYNGYENNVARITRNVLDRFSFDPADSSPL